MLTCQEVTAKASLMIDGELGFRERLAVRLHLMMCVHCRRFARQFEALVSGMALLSRTEPEIVPGFVDRVMLSLDGPRESSSFPPGRNDE